MGTTITIEQNSEAAKAAAENLSSRFEDAGVNVEIIAHKAGKKHMFSGTVARCCQVHEERNWRK